jgi:hypothetical protein
MIKRLSATVLLTAALAVGTGAGVADAKPGHGKSGHTHGFQNCMAAAHTAYRAELAAGVSGDVARMHLHDAQAKCRTDFPHPRGK